MKPMLYKTGGSGATNKEPNDVGGTTISRNYSPVKDNSSSFGWRLAGNNHNHSSSTTFERNALLQAVTNNTE